MMLFRRDGVAINSLTYAIPVHNTNFMRGWIRQGAQTSTSNKVQVSSRTNAVRRRSIRVFLESRTLFVLCTGAYGDMRSGRIVTIDLDLSNYHPIGDTTEPGNITYLDTPYQPLRASGPSHLYEDIHPKNIVTVFTPGYKMQALTWLLTSMYSTFIIPKMKPFIL